MVLSLNKIKGIVKHIKVGDIPDILGPDFLYKNYPELISRPTAYKLFADKDFPATKVSGVLVTTKEKFVSWLESQLDLPGGYLMDGNDPFDNDWTPAQDVPDGWKVDVPNDNK